MSVQEPVTPIRIYQKIPNDVLTRQRTYARYHPYGGHRAFTDSKYGDLEEANGLRILGECINANGQTFNYLYDALSGHYQQIYDPRFILTVQPCEGWFDLFTPAYFGFYIEYEDLMTESVVNIIYRIYKKIISKSKKTIEFKKLKKAVTTSGVGVAGALIDMFNVRVLEYTATDTDRLRHEKVKAYEVHSDSTEVLREAANILAMMKYGVDPVKI